jgi:signal peptidase I
MKQFLKIFVEFIELTFIGVGMLLLSYVFVGQLLEVSGESMYPTIKDKEQLLAEKITIKYQNPKRGEIVIISHPTEPGVLLVKRIVGLPGETIMMKDGYVYIDGKVESEAYLPDNTKTFGNLALRDNTEYKIADNTYVVLGDNRGKSTDSRYWGAISKSAIVGHAWLVYYPLSHFRFIK